MLQGQSPKLVSLLAAIFVTILPGDPTYGPRFILSTALFLWHAAGWRNSVRRVRQHSVAKGVGVQIAQRETEYRLHRRRRQGGERHPRLLAHGEYRGAVRRRRQAGGEDLQAVREAAEVQRLPQDAGQRRQRDRRRNRHHSDR